MGFSKRTLNYMKKNVQGDKPFTLNKHVKERVNQWEMVKMTTEWGKISEKDYISSSKIIP